MLAEAGHFVPGLPAVGGAEDGRVFDAGVNGIRIAKRWLQMPNALELPRVRRSVIPLVRPSDTVVFEFVSNGRPGFAAVVGALHDLAKPAAGLRRVDSVGVHRRAFDVINLPSAKM